MKMETENFKDLTEKLFADGVSDEERDMLCYIVFGKSFENSIEIIRYEDFIFNVRSKRYMITSISGFSNNERDLHVFFVCEYTDSKTLCRQFANYKEYLPEIMDSGLCTSRFIMPPAYPTEYEYIFEKHIIDGRFIKAVSDNMESYGDEHILNKLKPIMP